jgi:hypothetical protein
MGGLITMHDKVNNSLIFGGLPLLALPAVLLTSLFSLGGTPSKLFDGSCFMIIGTIIYALVYIPCAVAAAWTAKKQDVAFAFQISIVPLIFLPILVVLFLVVSSM